MHEIFRVEEISGWLLPEGEWYPAEDWWHIAALYDLRDAGYALLKSEDAVHILARGDEAEIRSLAATLGFVKISRSIVDGSTMTLKQLQALQELIEMCDPDSSIGFLCGTEQIMKSLSIERILKLKNPAILFLY